MGTDFETHNFGSIAGITPISQEAKDWISENIPTEPWQWQGGMLCIEPRCLPAILDAILNAGLKLN